MNAVEVERKFPLWRVFACIAVLISWSVLIKWGFQMDRSVGVSFAVFGRENPFILRFFYHFIGFAVWLVIPFCFSTQKSIAVFARNIGLIDRIELSACLYSGGAMVSALLAIGAIRLGIARGNPDAKHYFQGGELVWSGYLLIAILIGPIIEEVVTRGFLYGQLRQRLSIPVHTEMHCPGPGILPVFSLGNCDHKPGICLPPGDEWNIFMCHPRKNEEPVELRPLSWGL